MSRNLRAAHRPALDDLQPPADSPGRPHPAGDAGRRPCRRLRCFHHHPGSSQAAAVGDSIQIHPATYTEQVTINKSLTMQGTGTGVIIKSPTVLIPDLGEAPMVEINGGATVNINNLTIEGPAPLQHIPFDAAIDGIYVVGGATANVTGVTINNIGPEPLTGFQFGGRGILVGHRASTGQGVGEQVGHATITNCTITNYEKNGIWEVSYPEQTQTFAVQSCDFPIVL